MLEVNGEAKKSAELVRRIKEANDLELYMERPKIKARLIHRAPLSELAQQKDDLLTFYLACWLCVREQNPIRHAQEVLMKKDGKKALCSASMQVAMFQAS